MSKKNSKTVAASVAAVVASDVTAEIETAVVPAVVELTPAQKAKEFTKQVVLAVARMLQAVGVAGLDINYVLVTRQDTDENGNRIKTTIRDLCVALANPKQIEKEGGTTKPESETEILTRLGLSRNCTPNAKTGKPAPTANLLVAQVVDTAKKLGLQLASKGRTAKNDPIANAIAGLKLSAEDWAAKRAVATDVETEIEVDFSFLD